MEFFPHGVVIDQIMFRSHLKHYMQQLVDIKHGLRAKLLALERAKKVANV